MIIKLNGFLDVIKAMKWKFENNLEGKVPRGVHCGFVVT